MGTKIQCIRVGVGTTKVDLNCDLATCAKLVHTGVNQYTGEPMTVVWDEWLDSYIETAVRPEGN